MESPDRKARPDGAEILTIRDVADYLKLPVSTVYRLAERRDLPGHKVGRQWRFHKTVLDDWFRQHAASARTTVLVVDDEERLRDLMVEALRSKQRDVIAAASGEEALEVVKRTEVDVVLLDLAMPGLNGVETFRELHALRPALPVVIVTAYPDSELMAQALEIGPFTMVSKPVDMARIQALVDRIAGT